MAGEIPRLSFQVKDLPTKSVTLYPSRAHVVREICDVVLTPGQNEIKIHGLSPSVDENSVQIDGRGGASITDLTLELVPNTEDFYETYPVESDSSDSESEDDEDDEEIPAVKSLTSQVDAIELKINNALETQRSVERQLKILDQHANSIHSKNVDHDELTKTLSTYTKERANLFNANVDADQGLKIFRKEKTKLEAKRNRVGKDEEKREEKLRNEKLKVSQKKLRLREERQRERQRTEMERRKFWPAQVYQINLRLESSIDTPGSSRRNSIDGVTLSGLDTMKKEDIESVIPAGRTVSLSLSYVTNAAFWIPRYDLSISSLNKTASIAYRAEFSNGTSETWKDAKVILSTSQTSYSGLDDKAPTLNPWHVKLAKYEQASGGLLSSEESNGPRQRHAMAQNIAKKNVMLHQSALPHRGLPQSIFQSSGVFGNTAPQGMNQSSGLFGAPAPQGMAQQQQRMQAIQAQRAMQMQAQQAQQAQQTQQTQQAVQMQAQQVPQYGGFGASAPSQPMSLPDKKEMKKKKSGFLGSAAQTFTGDMLESVDFDSFVGDEAGADGALDFEESVWEDSGLTASYELPGTRTLAPSSLARRHKIASLHATNIQLSYIAVPKLRSAAFLRAKVRNPSTSVTLLKGTAGVTLDGSFLGNMPLPRVSPNQVFTLPLGVDPAIHINYPKPTLHRSTQGFLSKESAHTFNRSVWLTNTKSSSIDLVVLDQVPVSQDDKLKMEILHPKGLYKEGDAVKAGNGAKDGAAVANGNAWGKAIASLKKGGEIAWTVQLEKGQAALLKMEYEARMPTGENIVAV
jgi:hypothetical protein